MSEELQPFDENELSADDLAVLQAFDARETWNNVSSVPPKSSASPTTQELAMWPESSSLEQHGFDETADDMIMLFVSEADEDIGRMRRALSMLEQDDHIDPARFVTLRRVGHKIRGTAGAVECEIMATIAHWVEVIAEQIIDGMLFPVIGLNALAKAVSALEGALHNVIAYGKEHDTPLVELEAVLKELNIDLEEPVISQEKNDPAPQPYKEVPPLRISTRQLHNSSSPFISVDIRRVKRLIHHSEQLAGLRAPLENAQAEAETALQELHAAQARLRQIQPMLSSLLTAENSSYVLDEPSSSLVARILNDRLPRNDTLRKIKGRFRTVNEVDSSQWDELDIERYTAKDILIRTFNEAISDVTIASARVQEAFIPLNMMVQEYIAQASIARSDALLLRLAPLSTLIPHLEEAIDKSTLARKQHVQFEVKGEDIEVDQDILESLKIPLLQMVDTCIADTPSDEDAGDVEDTQQSCRIWFHANGIGNDITIEIGFSMTVNGGALDAIREPILRLSGTFSSQRNAAGGVSFYLRFPRSRGAVQCLLIRTGGQHLLVPFSQVQRISDGKREKLDMFYNLDELLGFPSDPDFAARVQPVLLLSQGASSRAVIGVAVDEVLGDAELVVKPLAPYLQRPGIAGSAIDAKGSVLLMVDLPELVQYYASLQ
ncbi:MAG: chemotaxis protein CheW, partial [Chloroflexi bacterium]|nr:chemotaxis protein CheW [Chloroflexota bacterium]